MAKAIATVGGVALTPGVSKNRRWYTREMIADAVADAQARIAAGESLDIVRRDDDLGEMSQLTHHQAGDDSTRIVGRVTGVSLDEHGNARFTAALADTPHGRTIASLVDTSDGNPPFLKGVSIRGYWKGTVRKVKGPDGAAAEQADGITLDGLDYTRSPGVTGARVDTFAWVKDGGTESAETTERVAICESVQEAHVSITEDTGQSGALREGLELLLAPPPHVLENGICVTCAAVGEGGNAPGNGKLPYGTVAYADPGYQADKQKRYPVDTKAHVRAALAYLAKKANAAKYTPAQLKRVMGRIRAAAKKFGITVAAESAGWTFDAPFQVSEAVAEHLGMGSSAGSWSVRASNGPVDICMSSYGMDPEDLDVILRAAADAACKALAALDPDMDGDIDVPGAGAEDTDGDAGGESAPDETQTETTPADGPAAATTGTEAPAMGETTTTPAGTAAPGIDPRVLSEAVNAELERREAERKAAKRAAKEKAERKAAKQAQENTALAQGTPATAGAAATETAEQREARLKAVVDGQFAAAAAREGLAAEETDEQIVARLLEERLVPLRQARAEGGGVQRKGLAALENLADGPGSAKLLEKASNEELAALAGAAFGPGRAR